MGSAKAIDICSPPGIYVPIMIHNWRIVYWFIVIVCGIVRVGVVWRVIRVVVICCWIPVICCWIPVIPTWREPIITIMIPVAIIMIPALIIMIEVVIIMSIG